MSKKKLNRRDLIKSAISLSAYSSVANLFGKEAFAQSMSFPPQKKLVWIQMSGGWDLLESVNPKPRSTSGIEIVVTTLQAPHYVYFWSKSEFFLPPHFCIIFCLKLVGCGLK